MQEEITQGAVSLSVEAGKMTADLLQKALKKVLEEMQKKPSQRTLRQGKQTLHQLKQHGASLTNIEITEQNIKAFSAVAKKYDIDYALKKDPHTEPPHYYVFFKARDKDQLQPAFKEFTAMTLGREKRPTIRDRLAEAKRECGERKPPDKTQQKKPPGARPMSRSKKWRLEWSFFLGENGRRRYNKICKGCVHPCKQSFRAVLIACPHYQSARSKKCADRG